MLNELERNGKSKKDNFKDHLILDIKEKIYLLTSTPLQQQKITYEQIVGQQVDVVEGQQQSKSLPNLHISSQIISNNLEFARLSSFENKDNFLLLDLANITQYYAKKKEGSSYPISVAIQLYDGTRESEMLSINATYPSILVVNDLDFIRDLDYIRVCNEDGRRVIKTIQHMVLDQKRITLHMRSDRYGPHSIIEVNSELRDQENKRYPPKITTYFLGDLSNVYSASTLNSFFYEDLR